MVKIKDQHPETDKRNDIVLSFSPDPSNELLTEALKQPTRERNNYFGVAKLADLRQLSPRKSYYVRDDVMFVQVFVEKPEMPVL